MEIGILQQSCMCIRVSTRSHFCHLLAITGALTVHMGDADLGGHVLAYEVEDITQGAVHTVFEALTQTHIEQRVEAAVEVSQAERYNVCQVKFGTHIRTLRGGHYKEIHDVQRYSAQEEVQHHSDDDPQGFLGSSPTSCHSPLCVAENHQVTN